MSYQVDDKIWQKMMVSLLQSESKVTQAGFFGGKTPAVYRGKSEADIMTINEYGSKKAKIPPRRAIGKLPRQKRKVIATAASLQGIRMIRSFQPNLGIIGSLMKNAIAANINNPTGMRRNTNSTARKKGFNNPLTHTGHLGSNVTSREVRNDRT